MSSVSIKIIIVFAVLMAIWFFVRVVRFLFPMVLLAIVLGYLWDWASQNENDKYDDFDEV